MNTPHPRFRFRRTPEAVGAWGSSSGQAASCSPRRAGRAGGPGARRPRRPPAAPRPQPPESCSAPPKAPATSPPARLLPSAGAEPQRLPFPGPRPHRLGASPRAPVPGAPLTFLPQPPFRYLLHAITSHSSHALPPGPAAPTLRVSAPSPPLSGDGTGPQQRAEPAGGSVPGLPLGALSRDLTGWLRRFCRHPCAQSPGFPPGSGETGEPHDASSV